MDKDSCGPSQSGQAGQQGTSGERDAMRDDRRPTGQAGTGQSGKRPAAPDEPREYDTDPQGGGGRLDQVNTADAAGAEGDAPSHGSR